MISKIDFYIDELASMKKYPDELFYIGNTELLKKSVKRSVKIGS